MTQTTPLTQGPHNLPLTHCVFSDFPIPRNTTCCIILSQVRRDRPGTAHSTQPLLLSAFIQSTTTLLCGIGRARWRRIVFGLGDVDHLVFLLGRRSLFDTGGSKTDTRRTEQVRWIRLAQWTLEAPSGNLVLERDCATCKGIGLGLTMTGTDDFWTR